MATKKSCVKKKGCAKKAPAKKENLLVLTKEKRDKMTPASVLNSLKEGNKSFVNKGVTPKNHKRLVKESAAGQAPMAAVISCFDSRIPVEDVFNKSIGDLFVGRVAGNFVNVDLLGSLEFACKAVGSKLVVVLGHDSCGAIVGTINDVKLGNLTAMLKNMKPAVTKTNKEFKGKKDSSNPDYVRAVAKNNVVCSLDYIRKKSPVLKAMEKAGEIKIVGAYYDMLTGKVDFMNA